jgi:hypothetical protein
MDSYPEIKGLYIIMDNAPIHIVDKTKEMFLKERVRKYVSSSLLT